jgi:hypothetical protein
MSGKKIVLVFAPICLTLCVLISIRSAVADVLWTQRSLGALLRLMPDHVAARVVRSEPGDLEIAVTVAPAKAAALLELALQEEVRGDLVSARKHLDEAARRDATFRPRWAIINFLVRHGETKEVLSRAAAAAAIYEGDLSALFDLCLRTGENPDRIYRTIVPARAKAQREYLELLIRRGKQIEALPAALRLADMANPRDRDLLFDYCDQLLAGGAGLKAAQLWKGLPRFGAAKGHCLDWKGQPVEGITVIETGETVVRLELSGRQPESAVVLRRTMIVEPGRRYHLRALVSGGDTIQGAVEWQWNAVVVGTGDRADVEVEAKQQISELALVIRRRPGHRAAEGTLEITNIRLEPKSSTLAGAGYAGRRAVWRPTIFQVLPSLTHIIMKWRAV